MNERKDEKWLNEQLQKVVDGTKPVFDADAWKHKHGDAYRTLLSRGSKGNRPASGSGRVVRIVLGSWIGRLAVAAVVAFTAGLLIIGRSGHGSDGPVVPPAPVAQVPPARMMSMMSLRTTYEQGGFEALDRQLHDTLDEFGPRSSSVPVRELFNM